jgi:hypothetical protein
MIHYAISIGFTLNKIGQMDLLPIFGLLGLILKITSNKKVILDVEAKHSSLTSTEIEKSPQKSNFNQKYEISVCENSEDVSEPPQTRSPGPNLGVTKMLEKRPSFCLETENSPSFPNASDGLFSNASEDSSSPTEIMIGNRELKLFKFGLVPSDTLSSKDILELREVQGKGGIASFYDRIDSPRVFDFKSQRFVIDPM